MLPLTIILTLTLLIASATCIWLLHSAFPILITNLCVNAIFFICRKHLQNQKSAESITSSQNRQVLNQNRQQSSECSSGCRKILSSQLSFSIAFSFWLFYFNSNQLIFYVPLILSMTGKLSYVMCWRSIKNFFLEKMKKAVNQRGEQNESSQFFQKSRTRKDSIGFMLSKDPDCDEIEDKSEEKKSSSADFKQKVNILAESKTTPHHQEQKNCKNRDPQIRKICFGQISPPSNSINSRFNQSLYENYIILQGKLELILVCYLIITFGSNAFMGYSSAKTIIVTLWYIVLLRVKYQFNYSLQKAINELHIDFDSTFKKMGFRSFYHKFYQFLVKVSKVQEFWDNRMFKNIDY